ncbi:MAG: CGP-CTERM sorting domain-containing protein [Candidatus Altiarchaeales archaeon]|nr:MAG: CGP-CTERM sorting domain-containing protein [Candidatus Altiarchaeales archaeon]
MKRSGILALLFVFVMVLSPLAAAEKGPAADIVYIGIRTNQETAITDVAKGDLDIFLHSVSGATFKDLPEDILNNVELIKSASGYWEITINMYHDPDDPYLVTVGEKKYFNPFAIREVRFALNFLISRQYIVQNILQGSGAAMFGSIRPSTGANTYFEPVYKALGLSATADIKKAQDIFERAMKKAAEDLAAKGYKLELKQDESGNTWWYFEGEPVTIKFIIRIEDERKDEGLYIADLLEKYFHIKVDRLLWDRKKASGLVFAGDPKNYEWNLYTGGWISTVNVKWPDDYTAFFNAAWYYGWIPFNGQTSEYPKGTKITTVKEFIDYIGGAEAAIENLDLKYYNTPEKLAELYDWTIEEVTKLLVLNNLEYNGKKYELKEGNVDQYWDLQKLSMGLAIMDSVRVFTSEQWEYFTVNKERVKAIARDVSSGLWTRWSLITAETPDKVVKVAEYSATGALFMSAFNPVGGIDDVYSSAIWRVVSDYAIYTDLSTGTYIPVRCTYKVERGPVKVPDDAVIYNSTIDQWVAAHAGEEAKAKITYDCKFGNWHDGHPMTMADIKYFAAFNWEWSTLDGDEDPYYDSKVEGAVGETLKQVKGIQWVDEDTYVVYTDLTHPVADDVMAYTNVLWAWAPQPWQLLYAESELVAKGDEYGASQKYSFSEEAEGIAQLDLLVKDHVADLKKVLEALKNKKAVPAAIADEISDPSEGYTKILNWIDSKGHAVISNGPFYIEKYDPDKIFLELRAFRDPTYPFDLDYWKQRLILAKLELAGIEVPTRIFTGDDLKVAVKANMVEQYPETGTKPADKGFVFVEVKDEKGQTVFSGEAKLAKAGSFEVVIPGSETAKWEAGKYEVYVKGGLEEGVVSFTDKKTIIVIKKEETTSPSPSPTTSSPSPTESPTSSPSPTETGGICGPAVLVGLALIPLLLRRKK